MKKLLIVMLSVMLVLGMVGCGSGGSGGSSEGGSSEEKSEKKADLIIEPIEVLSEEEVEEFTGYPVIEVSPSEQPAVGVKIAFFDLGDAGYVQLSLYQTAFLSNSNFANVKELYDNNKQNLEVYEDNVQGAGEDAYFSGLGLEAIEGDYSVTIMVSPSGEKSRQLSIDIANRVFENIKKLK